MFDIIRDEIGRHRRHFGRKLHVGVFKLGGHGDFMQALAFARAARRRWPRAQATLTLMGRASTSPVNADLLRGCPFVDSCIQVPAADWRALVQELAPAFDVFYDVQYVAAVYYRKLGRFAAEQLDAHVRLARYAYYYSRFPHSNAALAETGQSQWQMLARSSGLDVDEGDLFVQPEDPPPPSAPPSEPYVTLHNAAGGLARVKCAPPAVFEAVARRVRDLGLVPVQVGLTREPTIAACLDRRGLAINATAALLQRARLHVDVEGGLVYVARAVGTRSVVFFGPTPAVTFGFRDNVNVSLGRCRACWWSGDGWERRCLKGHPHCRNLPDAAAAARIVERALGECRPPSDAAARLDAPLSHTSDAAHTPDRRDTAERPR